MNLSVITLNTYSCSVRSDFSEMEKNKPSISIKMDNCFAQNDEQIRIMLEQIGLPVQWVDEFLDMLHCIEDLEGGEEASRLISVCLTGNSVKINSEHDMESFIRDIPLDIDEYFKNYGCPRSSICNHNKFSCNLVSNNISLTYEPTSEQNYRLTSIQFKDRDSVMELYRCSV